jgi:hypothetical protein
MKNISDIAANISAAKNPVVDVWRLGLMAVELGTAAVTTIMLPKGIPQKTQERAYTSPIWYSPQG